MKVEIIKPKYSKHLQTNFLSLIQATFNEMCRSKGFVAPAKRGFLLFDIYRQPLSDKTFVNDFFGKGLWGYKLFSLGLTTFQRSQVFDAIKNVVAHGGEALIVAHRYMALKQDKLKYVVEVIVWDNGDGIADISQALEPGFTSCKHLPISDMCGQGLGLDRITDHVPVISYIADEIIIESGSQLAYRTHKRDSHRFKNIRRPVPGTRVTLRFWQGPEHLQ